jgi:class 3 adenylate cyclase/tetratricopeptide (TPR) repeat protein
VPAAGGGLAVSGERKQVSVLFSDVVGSMLLAERLDPERLRVVMAELTRRCADCVTRFEGMIDKFTGDGVMALFGAPVALEDHARRACYAGLEMQRSVTAYATELREAEGIELALRVGINSGEVIVGDIATADRFTYTAIGHTVGLAQRMEALAAPGSVYLTGYAARLAQGFLALRELGPHQVKGSSRPLDVFELVGLGTARGHIDVATGRGLSRFVGREAELRELGDALARASGGDGQVVGVIADPGLGKSRLVAEFVQDARTRGVEVHEGHCQAHARALPLVPVLEMLRSYFGVTEDLGPDIARARIEARVLQVDRRLDSELPLIFEFLAVPDPDRPLGSIDPEARRRRLLELIRRLVRDPGRERVVVNVIEDAHWIDPASDEFLANLVEATAGARNLVVVTFRPEYAAAWMRRSWYRQLPLSPLPPDLVAGLLGELLGPDPSLDGLAELIAARTGGNPFFLEEVTRDLAETGVLVGEQGGYRLGQEIRQVAIPETVQAVLAARIDRLGHQAKDVIAAAAVIGREFDRDLLERVAQIPPAALEATIARLVEAELIAQTEVYPVAVYAFRHPLTHEVALGALLTERRRELHHRAARAIAELNADRTGEVAALIAQHYEQAGLALEACTWHLTAATWATANDHTAAIGYLNRVRALDPELPDGAEADLLRANARAFLLAVGWRIGADPDRMREVFDESVAAATRAHDDRLLAQVQIAYTACIGLAGCQWDEVVERVTEFLQTARRSGDLDLAAVAQGVAAVGYGWAGRFSAALKAAEAAVELTADHPDRGAGFLFESPRGVAMLWRGLVLAALGSLVEALVVIDETEAFLRGRGFKETLCWRPWYRLIVLRVAGADVGEAEVAIAREALAIAEAISGPYARMVSQTTLAMAYLGVGRFTESVETAGRAITVIETSGTGRDVEALARYIRALALTESGDPIQGMAEAERAIRYCIESGNRFHRPPSCAAFALAAAAAGTELAHALRVLDDGERVVAETGAPGLLPELLHARARVLAAIGDHESRRAALERGLEVAGENGAHGWEKRFGDALAGRTVPVDPPHIGERGKPWEEVDRPGPSAVVAAEVE